MATRLPGTARPTLPYLARLCKGLSCSRSRCFGQSVSVKDSSAETRVEGVTHRGGKWCAAREEELQGRQITGSEGRLGVEHSIPHRWDARQSRQAMGRRKLQHAYRVESTQGARGLPPRVAPQPSPKPDHRRGRAAARCPCGRPARSLAPPIEPWRIRAGCRG